MTDRSPFIDPAKLSAETHIYLDTSGLPPKTSRIVDLLTRVLEQLASAEAGGTPLTLRVTSFSHELEDDAPVLRVDPVRDLAAQVREHLAVVPMATGGTDFGHVFERINSSRARANRRNLIISDLLWSAEPADLHRLHPLNLDYLHEQDADLVARERFEALLRCAERPRIPKILSVDQLGTSGWPA